MKIDPTEKQAALSNEKTVRPASGEKNALDFAKVLGNTVECANETTVQRGHLVGPMVGPDLRIPTENRLVEIQTAHRLIDALENYQKLINDPKANLKMIEPAVECMSDLSEKVGQILDQMPQGHPVRAIAQEAMVHISKEIERFNMGYYVDG